MAAKANEVYVNESRKETTLKKIIIIKFDTTSTFSLKTSAIICIHDVHLEMESSQPSKGSKPLFFISPIP